MENEHEPKIEGQEALIDPSFLAGLLATGWISLETVSAQNFTSWRGICCKWLIEHLKLYRFSVTFVKTLMNKGFRDKN
ncbi:MAG: hypothetical protein WCS94_02290, partial [Verrucomicrobiota bacterium]